MKELEREGKIKPEMILPEDEWADVLAKAEEKPKPKDNLARLEELSKRLSK